MSPGETARVLAEAARAAPSADNSQPWQFSCNATHFFCHYSARSALDPFGPGGHATLLSVGAVAENLHQLLGGRIEPALEDLAQGAPYFSVPLIDPPSSAAGVSHPLFVRHTNRFPFKRQPVPTALIAELATMFEGPTRLVLLGEQSARNRLADIAKTCCQARFCNRELHEWLMDSLRWPNEQRESDDGLDVNTLDLPPGGRRFMRFIRPWQRLERLNHWLGLYRVMALAEVQPLRQGPLIACVVGEETPQGSFSAGRLMQRTWLHLNSRGWAVHPFYVVPDQYTRLRAGRLPDPWVAPVTRALADLPALVGLSHGERMHMALRIGLPTKTPPRSRRLALDRLLFDHASIATET